MRSLSKEYQAQSYGSCGSCGQSVDEKGLVQIVSFGTSMGLTKDFYQNIKLKAIMPDGQAIALLYVVERIRQFL